jgi:hypothetical protein
MFCLAIRLDLDSSFELLPNDSILKSHTKKLLFAEFIIFTLGVLLLTVGGMIYSGVTVFQNGLTYMFAGSVTLISIFVLECLACCCYRTPRQIRSDEALRQFEGTLDQALQSINPNLTNITNSLEQA